MTEWRVERCVTSCSEELLLMDKGLTVLPMELVRDRARYVKTLNLAENHIESFDNFGLFTSLDTLVLDKNSLTSLAGLPRLETVTTLWFNNNSVDDMAGFLDTVEASLPNLRFLSVMRNPASPPMIVMSEEDDKAAQRHRLYVVYRLPKLTFLDASPVTAKEREEARVRGKFLATRKPTAKAAATTSSPSSPSAAPSTEDRTDSTEPGKREMTAYLNIGKSHYDGSHSEGNRFIVNDDL